MTNLDDRGETLIFTCAGAAYSGQVANRAGVRLAQDGVGNLFCAAAVAAERPDKLARSRAAARRVVVDGCEDHCARRVLENAGLPVVPVKSAGQIEFHHLGFGFHKISLGLEYGPGLPPDCERPAVCY